MYERTPRGGTRWGPSSIKSLIDRARKLGVLDPQANVKARRFIGNCNHPAAFRSRAAFAAFPRNSAISTGPSENSPALAFAVRTRR